MSEENDRVTVAVLKVESNHIRKDIQMLRGDIKDWRDDHEKRIRVLERLGNWRWLFEGLAVLLGGVAVTLGLKKP